MTITVATVALALIALAGVIVLALASWTSPKLTLVVWVSVLLFIPVWVGVSVGIFWSAIVAVTCLAIASQIRYVRFVAVDAVALVLVVILTVLLVLGEVEISPYATTMLDWLLFYFWGRIAAASVPRPFLTQALAASAVVLAALALIEFATGTNLFTMIPGSGADHTTWSPLQERGGFLRAEGALGHSIALGAVLAMLSAFVLAARWHIVVKVVATAFLGGAVVVTFSRIGLVTFVLTVALSILLLRELGRRAKVTVGALMIVAALIAIPFLSSVFDSAGEEADGSAGYRSDLLVLLTQVQLVGGSQKWESLVVGDTYLGFFAHSVDNAVMSVLLKIGYIPTALLFSVLIVAIVQSFRRLGDAAGVAVLSQIPSLFVVAMITQYGMLLWFLVGVAATPTRVWTEARAAGARPLARVRRY